MLFGIDFGAKTSGNTAICYGFDEDSSILQVEKRKNADLWLQEQLLKIRPKCVAIDAALSLPSAYFGIGHDYMYRHADRQLRGMSPMFLGGITARAIAFRDFATNHGAEVIEAYPGAFMRKRFANLQGVYKKHLQPCQQALLEAFPDQRKLQLENWHQFDAWVCWLIARLSLENAAFIVGEPAEGLIYY